MAEGVVTEDRARTIRTWKCEEGRSFGDIAADGHEEFAGAWDPPRIPLLGDALCRKAAEILGEDGEEAPWN